MKRKVGISLYLFLAVVIGFLCYWAFDFFLFLLYGFQFSLKFISIDIPPDIPFAIVLGIIMVAGVGIYLYLGKRFIKNGRIIALALVLIGVSAYLCPYVIDLKGEIGKKNDEKYATTHESKMVNEVNQVLIELNLPFTLDLKNSHYDTLYYNRHFGDNYLRLYFEKIKEGNLTDEEVWQLLSILPEKQRDYWISITYEEGKNTFFFHNCLYARSFEEKVGNDESEMVNKVNQVITESNLPFAVNLKTSHYDTLRHNDMLRVQVEKTNEEGLTLEEIEQLVKMLPEQQNAYRMEIVYGKSTYEKRIGSVFRSKEKSIIIFLDENKKVTECSGQDQELCEAIELLVGCSS